MPYWLLKSDPDEYSAHDLQRDTRTTWNGVSSAAALIHLRAMKRSDEVLIYHTGDERAIVALANVTSAPRPDPADKTGKLVIIDLAFARMLPTPVTLAQIKADPIFKDFALVRQGRLSVMPVPDVLWMTIVRLAGK